ncbi:hypothetical protein ACJMK2_011995 [Sinanodonta woodiana]|uniref:Protein kinase domain-containing protein n=1 Tax=Sinanodonta woodiana TaxID=1069815 RepID=A0ABD3V6S7_SINWO
MTEQLVVDFRQVEFAPNLDHTQSGNDRDITDDLELTEHQPYHDMGSDAQRTQHENDRDMRSDVERTQHENNQDMGSDAQRTQHENNQDMGSDAQRTQHENDRDMRSDVERTQHENNQDMRSDAQRTQHENNQDMRSDVERTQHENNQVIRNDAQLTQHENNQYMRSDVEHTQHDNNQVMRDDVDSETVDNSDTSTDNDDNWQNGKNPNQPHGLFQDHPECNIQNDDGDIFATTKIQKGIIQNNPRYCQIIILSVEKMRRYIGEKIGEGSFGIVHKATITDGEKCMFAIKKIPITEEVFQISYDKEIDNGRILHPFINPIIARAESRPSNAEKGISYIMYPYMKNRDLRRNIDRVNRGRKLSSSESNSTIWIRCIYQIAQGMDFLHKPVSSVRRAIFHRDLTSSNILLDENFNVRIGDFGIAVEAGWNTSHATISAGTGGYCPPSLKHYKYNASSDTFTVGVVMLEILTGLKASLSEEPFNLYNKYNVKGGYNYLKDDLNMRAADNEAARWENNDRRDKLAKIALNTVRFDGRKRKEINLLKELEDMRLDARERYQKPTTLDRCVSCCVNPIVKLSTKGPDCVKNVGNNPCQYFCLHCITSHHFNPLVCPQHGSTRPPFGDYVYGVFVAGNNVDAQHHSVIHGRGHDNEEVAKVYIRDVKKVVQVLKATHPLVLGANEQNLRVVTPEQPGAKENMEPNVKKAFKDLSDSIKQEIEEKSLDPKRRRLPNSLFIFYFSGHCSKDKGLQLGNTEETLNASTPWMQEMLHTELGVEQIVIILDCCHADSQTFIHTHVLDTSSNSEYGRQKATIVQISSCTEEETSNGGLKGSYFTDLFCRGLLGLDSTKDDKIKFCEECVPPRTNPSGIDSTLPCGKYHNQCLSDNGVTVYALKDFIRGHLKRKNVTMTPVQSAQREKEVFLAYYNPYKRHISIHIKDSSSSEGFSLCYDPGSMNQLRQDILIYIVESNSHSELSLLYKYMGSDCSHLIAIHQRYGTDRNRELCNLDDIYKSRFCGRELEAQVRDNINGLSNGPVKLSKISKTTVKRPEAEFNEKYLKINQKCIEIAVKSITIAENQLKEKLQSSNYTEDVKTLFKELLTIIRLLRTVHEGLLANKQDNVFMFHLYNEFSVLRIQ